MNTCCRSCTVQYVAVGDTVLSGDAEDTLEAQHVEGFEAALLAHVCGPRFAGIEEGVQQTGLVDSHLGVLSEHLIFSYSFGQLGHRACGFSDAPVYLSVQRKGDNEYKLSAGKAIDQPLEGFPEWAVRDASSANSISLTYTSVPFVLARRRARLNSFPSDLVCRYIPSQEESKAYDRRREKKIPNNFGARTQPCLTPLQTGRGSNVEPSYTTVPFMSSWKETTMLRSLGGQPIFSSRRKNPFLLTKSKALVKSMNTT